MKPIKVSIFTLVLTLIMPLVLIACNSAGSRSSVFPNINSKDIPDVLEMTVGTVGDTYFTSFGPSKDNDYQSYFLVTFENTTDADYTALMEHYTASSTGSDEDSFLFFDWGRLHAVHDDNSIFLQAWMY